MKGSPGGHCAGTGSGRGSPEWTGFDGLVQLISVDGQRTVGCPYWDLVADVDAAQLRDLYRDMAVVRRIDTEAMALQRQGELALWAPLLGQEAAQVGSARALRPRRLRLPELPGARRRLLPRRRPGAMLRLWRGAGLSGWDPAAYGIATPAIVVGSQALHATGYAFGITLDGATSAAVAYFGDGATSEGDVAEAFGFAASYVVPVVFFCQNNQWAISEPVRLQSHASIAQRGRGYGIPGIQVDGNDVLAVLAATRLALARASPATGPTLIEAVTYRMGPHTTSDDPTRYRSHADEEEWRAKDPLARLRALLHTEGLVDDRFDAGGRGRARTRWRPHCAGVPGHARPGTGRPVRPRVRRSPPACSDGGARMPTPTTWPGSTRTLMPGDHVLGKALNAGLRQAMERDPKVVLMGEDIGKLGGVFRVTEGLQRDFGDRRVIDTPLAESGVIGHGRRAGHARLPAGV